MKLFSFKFYFIVFLISVFLGSASADNDDKWTGHFEIFGKPGTDRSLIKGDLFLPLYQNEEFLLFGNLRANFDDQSNKEGNAGVGARRLFDEWIFGGWVFLDWKESKNSNSFKQASVGGEFLSNDWDFRANGYFAESKREDVDDISVVEINGNQIQARLGEERALPGADFEVGRKLPIFDDSRIFLGAFHYDANDFENISGPRARLEMRFHELPLISTLSKDSRLTLGTEYTDDSVRGSQWFGLIQLRIPFGTGSKSKRSYLTPLERRMVETVVRDDDVITNETLSDDTVPVVNPKTGDVITNVESINASTANVSNTIANAGENSLIIADGSQGVITVGASTINTLSGQIIAGGGAPVSLQAMKPNGSLLDLSYTPPGQRPSISRVGNGDLVYVNNDDGVILNAIDVSGGRPLRINNSANVCVFNTNISNSAGNRQGIYLQNNSNVRFENVMVSNTGREGILMQSNSSAVFNNLAISNTGREGFEVNNSVAQIQYATISDANFESIRAFNGSNLVIDNLLVTRSNREGIELNNSSLSLTNSLIQDINVSGGDDGIFANNNSILRVDNVQIDNVTSQGIFVNNASTANIANSSVRNTVHEAVYANNSTLTLDNTIISNSGREGLQITNSTAQVNDVSIVNSSTQGLRVNGVSNTTITNISITSSNSQGVIVQNTASATFDDLSIDGTGAQGVLLTNNSSTILNFATITNTGNNGIQHQNNATLNANNILISNTANDGIRASGGNFTLDNSVIQDIGNGGGNDDALHLTNTTLSGANNSIQGTIDNGLACRTNAGNIGSIGFTSGPISSCP